MFTDPYVIVYPGIHNGRTNKIFGYHKDLRIFTWRFQTIELFYEGCSKST